MTTGHYYLHTNGELIYKPATYDVCDIRDSDFSCCIWRLDTQDRELAWNLLVEALASGVSSERINGLAELWHCDNDDAEEYAKRVGCKLSKHAAGTDEAADYRRYCAYSDAQGGNKGYGKTALEAMAALANCLGYKPFKMWGATFKDLLAKVDKF